MHARAHTEAAEITSSENALCEGKRHRYVAVYDRSGNTFGMKFSQTVLARWVFLAHLRARIRRAYGNYTARFTTTM